jgi:hypothetical protein
MGFTVEHLPTVMLKAEVIHDGLLGLQNWGGE